MDKGKSSWTSKPVCGGNTRRDSPNGVKGSPCQRPAGWGTDHPGYGKCKHHGGATPSGRKAALMEMIRDEVRKVMGPAIEVDPMEALLWCIRIAAGEVAFATYKIEQLDETEAVGSPITTTERSGISRGDAESWVEETKQPIELNIWIRTRRESTDRLAKYSKMALDAGIAERQINLAESAGEQLAVAIQSILAGLGLSAEQEEKAPMLVRSALIELEKAPSEDVEYASN